MPVLSPEEVHIYSWEESAASPLPEILGRYLNLEPEQIRFEYNSHGKPSLKGTHSLSFNVSHSNGLNLLAVTTDRSIGVDVEYIRPVKRMEAIARRYSWPLELCPHDFFEAWTAREAVLKAIGTGLGVAPHRIDTNAWERHSFEPRPGYVATLAYPKESRPLRVRYLDQAGTCQA